MPWRTQVDVYGWGPEWSLNGFPSRGSGVRVPFPAPYAKPCSARRSARPSPSPEHPLKAILLFPAIPRFRIPPEKPVGEAVRRRPLGLRDHMRVVPERRRRVAVRPVASAPVPRAEIPPECQKYLQNVVGAGKGTAGPYANRDRACEARSRHHAKRRYLVQTRRLGRHGPELTVLGLGSWVFSGAGALGLGPSDDQAL